jgi:Flp pilus assembly protein TadG
MTHRPAPDDGGSAIIEFVFVAVLVMVPLVYLVVAVAGVQRSELAVSQAAREAGRAFATSDSAAEAYTRARAAVHIALDNQGLPDDAQLRFVPAGASCTGGATTSPALAPGAQFTVCVVRTVDMPAVPSVLTGHGVRTVGEYVVHVDDYRVVS